MLAFKKNYKKYTFGAGIFCALLGSAEALTLKEALMSAITHPQVLAADASLKASEAGIDQAEAAFYPSLDLAVPAGLGYVREDLQPNALNSESKGEVRTFQNSPALTLRQLLYDGGVTASQVKKSEAVSQQALGTYLQAVDSKALDATTAYIEVLRLEQLKKITERQLHFHHFILKKMAKLVKQGEALEGDELQAQSRLDDIVISLASIQGDLSAASAVFQEVVGKAPEQLSSVTVPSPALLEEVLEKALQQNKSLLSARADVRSAKATRDAFKARFLPAITFEAAALRDQNAYGERGVQLQGTALVVLRYNLYSGGADTARYKEAGEYLESAGKRLAVQKRAVEQDVQIAWANLKSAEQQSASLDDAVKNKKELVKIYEIQLDKDLRSLLDFLSAIDSYYGGRAQKVSLEATISTMRAKILAASSSLLAAFQVAPPNFTKKGTST